MTNCGGRTRSIIAAHLFRRMKLANPVFALKGGTGAWRIAGWGAELVSGDDLPHASASALALAEQFAARLEQEDNIGSLGASELNARCDSGELFYILDFRQPHEFVEGHPSGRPLLQRRSDPVCRGGTRRRPERHSGHRGTSWTFDYNARCALRAEELGFDLVFGLAQWLGKGGYGGAMRFREHEIDPFITSAALAPLTKNIILISTIHILYGWHPLHLAKYGGCVDHISRGRWGLNVVTQDQGDGSGARPRNQNLNQSPRDLSRDRKRSLERVPYYSQARGRAGRQEFCGNVQGRRYCVMAGSQGQAMGYRWERSSCRIARTDRGLVRQTQAGRLRWRAGELLDTNTVIVNALRHEPTANRDLARNRRPDNPARERQDVRAADFQNVITCWFMTRDIRSWKSVLMRTVRSCGIFSSVPDSQKYRADGRFYSAAIAREVCQPPFDLRREVKVLASLLANSVKNEGPMLESATKLSWRRLANAGIGATSSTGGSVRLPGSNPT